MKRGKIYLENSKKINDVKFYSPSEAINLLKTLKFAKFDETVEVHFNLGIDPRHADQQLRGILTLPNGTGKSIKILVIAQGDKAKEAIDAGADYVGDTDMIEKIKSGWIDFDLVIATPNMMSKLGQLGKILGSKGLMPSPKSGTVTNDVAKTTKEFKAGKVEYRNDKTGIIHLGIGKLSFTDKELVENFELVYDTLIKEKPAKSKGVYLKSIVLASTMGRGIKIEPLKIKWKDNNGK